MLTSKPPNEERLLKWDDLLSWQKDNEYILTGYRQASFSWRRSAVSVFSRHNETINIWSHLLGGFSFAFVPLYVHWSIRSSYPNANPVDILQIFIYFIGVTVCFTLSSFFHTFLNHSKEVWKLGNELDHLGIVLVIWGSMVPSDYFGFYCSPVLQCTYILIVGAPSRRLPFFLLKRLLPPTGHLFSDRLRYLHHAAYFSHTGIEIPPSNNVRGPRSVGFCSRSAWRFQ